MRQVSGPETDGQLPRAAHAGNSLQVCLGGLVLLAISPAAFVAAVVTVWAVLRQARRHWWEAALAAAGLAAAAGIVVQVVTGNLLRAQFGGYIAAASGQTSWLGAVARTMPLGVLIGIAVGAIYVGMSEAWTGGAEWHPIEQRRRAVHHNKAEARYAALIADPDAAKRCSTPPLGVCRGGDLTSWIEDRFVVLAPGQSPAMGLVGESGSGKTVTAERLAYIWGAAGRKVFFADFKGSDPELPGRILAGYRYGRGTNVPAALWPAQPLDMWRGSPTEVLNRLLQVQEFTEPYYEAIAETAVRLAIHAPDIDGRGPVRDSASFLARLDADFLRQAYEHSPEARAVASVTRDPTRLDGVLLRYSGFFAALAGRLDHGWSFEDVDLGVLQVPTLGKRADAMAVARMILTDFGAYCAGRKPRVGEDVTLIVDEFSAVSEAAPMVIDLAERVRDVGGQVVVSAQSYQGLGRDDAERERMKAALISGGVIMHRMADPEEIVKAGGSVRAIETTHQLDHQGHTGMGSAKMTHKYRVDPDEVRQARTGEAWVISHGQAVHMSVYPRQAPAQLQNEAARLLASARWQATADLSRHQLARPEDWWEIQLPLGVDAGPRYLQLGPGSLGELAPGAPASAPELEPGTVPLDPRIVAAVRACVRAGQLSQARRLAEAAAFPDPARYVADLAAKRAALMEGPDRRRRSA